MTKFQYSNRIKVGVTLNRNTAIELPIPQSMLEQGSSNALSLYFNTSQPNGLLLYVGNEAATRMKRDTQKLRRPKTVSLNVQLWRCYLIYSSLPES